MHRFTPLLSNHKLISTVACITSISAITYHYRTTATANQFSTHLSLPTLHLFGLNTNKKSINSPCILALDLQSPFPDAPSTSILSQSMTLYDVINTINAAATDDNIHGIVANISQREHSWTLSQVQELSNAIQYFRSNNKSCVAYADSLGGVGTGMSNYVLGCTFDRIVVQQTCDFPLSGAYVENYFLRSLLDMLDVDFQLFRRKEYKNALNSISETGYTEGHKINIIGYTTSMLDQIIQHIAIGRNLTTDAVRDAIMHGVHNTDDALKRGLIDSIQYEHTLPDYCKQLCMDTMKYNINQHDTALTGKNQSLITDTKQLKTYRFENYYRQIEKQELLKRKTKLSLKQPRIALIYACGPVTNIAEKSNNPLHSLSGTFHSTTLAKTILHAATDKHVKAIVLRIDTPGGSVVASDTVYEAVRYASQQLHKPIICSYGNVSASGGVYSSVCADYIFANPGTITGSIGVIAGKPSIGRMLKNKLHVNAEGIELYGNIGRMGSLALPLNEQHVKIYEEQIDVMYNGFVQRVADGRKQSFSTIEQLARGRVYTGIQALELGLIDQLGGLQNAIEYARTYLDESEREVASVDIYPKKLGLSKLIQKALGTTLDDAEKDAEPLFNTDLASATNTTTQLFNELCETSHIANILLTKAQIPQIMQQFTAQQSIKAKTDQTDIVKL